ncbi:MAG: ATP-binding protein [Deltaproteobacteria bacterium]|nr:ATP-binding protein [Deltaproteobacteria bacterium]
MNFLTSPELISFEEFSKGIISVYNEEQLIRITANTLKALFRDYHYCIRLFSEREGKITSTIAEGPIIHSELPIIKIKESTAKKMGVYKDSHYFKGIIEFTEKYHNIFKETSDGTGTPIVYKGELLGLINLESSSGALRQEDKLLMILFANQLAVSVNNIRLLNRTETYRNFLYGIIDNAGVLISVVDSDGRIILINRFFKEKIGREFKDIIGHPVISFFPASERLKLHRAFLRLKSEKINKTNLSLLFKQGDMEFNMNMTLTPLRDTSGELQYIVAIGMDVTEFLDLKNQYEDARKLATIGEFASQISHELNNPITSIKVYTEYVKKKIGSGNFDLSDISEKIDRIETTIDRIQYFVKSIVNYARPFSENRERVKLANLINQALYFCQYLIEKNRIETAITVDQSIFITCYPNQLSQAIVNLITNAIQAMEEGGRLTIDGRSEDDMVVVSIGDTGKGIPEDIKNKIFEPFFSTRKLNGGVGLGLTIVKNAISAHNGKIEVESEVDKGTTFRIYLKYE